jgi:hypothetical protein
MAQLPGEFKTSEHEALRDFEALPAGWYVARIVESELCKCGPNAKDPNGKYYKLTFKLDEGQNGAGRQIWVNLNMVNANPKAVEIAQSELSSIAQAVEVPVVTDTEQLHGKPMKIKVALQADGRGEDFPPQNVIKKYTNVNDDKAVVGAADDSGGGSGKKKSWMK